LERKILVKKDILDDELYSKEMFMKIQRQIADQISEKMDEMKEILVKDQQKMRS